MAQITRLGLGGYSTQMYGSFSRDPQVLFDDERWTVVDTAAGEGWTRVTGSAKAWTAIDTAAGEGWRRVTDGNR
jgi:hypothetical protein